MSDMKGSPKRDADTMWAPQADVLLQKMTTGAPTSGTIIPFIDLIY